MPSLRDFVPYKTDTVERIARGRTLMLDDWIVILEDRLGQMKPLLDYFPAKALGDFPLNSKHSRLGGGSKITLDEPWVVSEFFSLSTRMLYVANFDDEKLIPTDSFNASDKIHSKDGKTTVWGLERKGRLLLINAEFEGKERGGSSRRGRKVSRLEIEQAKDIAEVLGRTNDTPREIWFWLAEIIEGARDFRRDLYEKTQKLALQTSFENTSFFYSPPIDDPLNRYHIPKTSIAG